MADEIKIQLKDVEGALLFPKTDSALVVHNATTVKAALTNHETRLGTAETKLSGIEAGAQVNKLEKVKVDGTALTIDTTDKSVNVVIPKYSLVKASTPTSGMLASYNLTKDGTVLGATIDIPKDFLVKSASVKTCTVKDQPIEGLNPGDPYIDFVINTKEGSGTDEHLYINVTTLVDVYTAGNGIVINDHSVAIDFDSSISTSTTKTVASKTIKDALDLKQNNLTTAQLAAVNSGITSTKVGEYDTHLADDVIHITASERSSWNAKQAAITGAATTIVSNNLTKNVAVISDNNGKIAVSTTTSTELGYVHGVTSAIQTQLDSKQPNITGAATTITSDNLTASKALVSNASGKVAASDTTATELGYVHGVTSAIQTQLNAKAADSAVVHKASAETVTGTKTFSVTQAFSAGLTSGESIAAQDSSTKVPTTAWVTGELSRFITYEVITD